MDSAEEILTVEKMRTDPEVQEQVKAMNAAFFSPDPIAALATLRNGKAQRTGSAGTDMGAV
jgi:hypothetical protein